MFTLLIYNVIFYIVECLLNTSYYAKYRIFKKLNPHNYPEVGTIIILLYAGGN